MIRGVRPPLPAVLDAVPVVQPFGRPAVLFERPESVCLSERPVFALVPDEPSVFEPTQHCTDRILVHVGTGRDLGGLERLVVVGDQKPEDLLQVGQLPEFVRGRTLERLDVDGHGMSLVFGRKIVLDVSIVGVISMILV